MRVKNLAKFCLDKSSDKVLSAKHTYQAELDRTRRSNRILSSYHKTHKGTRPKPIG